MKAERRHELKESDLGHTLTAARSYLDRNGRQIGIAVIVVAAVIAAIAFGVRSRAAAIEDVWRRKGQLSFENLKVGRESLNALATMTQAVTDERFVFASLMEQGQQALRLAQRVEVPPDFELNEQAGRAFEELLKFSGDNPLAIGIAYSGLATVEENWFVLDGDLAHKEKAEEYLVKIIDNPALSALPFVRMAMDRRKALDETFTKVEFADPVPPEEPSEPSDTP